ncbi:MULTISPECIES: TetR/AcrR family transcriptional regulator [Maribacter]|uniref:TetR/AcrR family transcriptional regulator n=1 Tax=Maribacter TaxID=252356 RepID=UPI00071992F3|nr:MULTISPECIES: TetR/AcrR family transcriptional regulator [Maribacter]APA63975.1 TetR family transcriptional regulator [Maribacter sp. 1_2014MBL_MicDiv]KSA13199.1 Regulatory protein TetR [Maribacter dokdonensis DSW-8]MBU2900940.1 TetR/AcrR family transcriptional regulator [Maribacter dokdonensis]MDP2526142.1 TetR/AcrR family transcriptional regulator [Maribacter dokdonensis]
MDMLLQGVQIKVNEKLYLKDPESSGLGKKIVEYSIQMINEIGFERFTFKKLGHQIGSNESSIYRYFENKHKLLVYLTSWYWGWMEYQLVFATHSIKNPKEKLLKSIIIITREIKEDSAFSHVNEVFLNQIVINEYSKAYLTKEVDEENKEGYYAIYKRLVGRLSTMISEVDADYEYPTSLASTILENGLHQHYLREHFPSLTDCNKKVTPTQYLTHLVFNTLKQHLNE